MGKQKILFAVGYREMEEYLKEKLNDEFEFVGEAVYREGIIKNIELKNPDIVIIRESLVGNVNILSIVNKIRTDYPNVRIIFLAKKRSPGDKVLSVLVSYGVYDILHDQKVIVDELISLIRKPNNYKDVSYLLPSATVDEKTNQVIFNTQGDVVKEIIVENVPDRNFDEENIENDYPKTQPKNTEEEMKNEGPILPKVIEPLETVVDEGKIIKGEKEKKSNYDFAKIAKSIKETTKEGFEAFKKPIAEEDTRLKENKKKSKEEKQHEEYSPVNEESNFKIIPGKKIITFLGGTRGAGNTSLAINFATYLAKKEKVIYVELNNGFQAVNYWYNFNFPIGIDAVLESIHRRELFEINNHIITKEYLLNEGDENYRDNYKKFPEGLNFLTYSRYKDLKDLSQYTSSEYKDLLLYLLFQLSYNYVVVDVNMDMDEELLTECLLISGKTYITITQDVKSIGNAVFELNNLGFQDNRNTTYIINKYNNKAMLNSKGVKKWLKTDSVLEVSDYKSTMIDANYIGLPLITYVKDKSFEKEIGKVVSLL